MKLSGKAGIVAAAILLNIYSAAPVQGQQTSDSQPALQETIDMQADALFFDAVKARIKGDDKKAEALLLQVVKLKPKAAGAYYDLSRLNMPEDPEQATRYIRKAIGLDDDNPYYKMQHAEVLAYRNQFEAAADVFAELADKEKYNENFLLKASMLYSRAGKFEQSIKYIDRLIADTGEDEEVLMQKQQIYLKMNDIDGAAAIARRLIERNPDEGRYYALLAEIYASNKMEEKAAEVYRKAEQLFPDDPAVQLSLAQYYRVNQDSAKSEEFTKKAVSNKSLDAETQLALLVSYFREAGDDSARRNESIKLAEDIARQNATNARVQAVYGDILSLVGNSEKATAQYKRALDLDPSSFQVWQNMLFGYTDEKHADSLIANSERALRLFPNQAMLHYLNGIGHLNKKDPNKAAKSLQRAIDMQPEDDTRVLAEMYAMLGDIYSMMKDYKKSDENYELALELAPDNATVLNNYSYYLSVRGMRLDDAEKMSGRSLELRPGEATFLDTYGWVLYKQGNYKKAKEYIQKAIDASTNVSGTLWEHLGDIEYKLNNKEKALELWKKAKENGTENDDIDKKIKDKTLYE